MRLPYRLRFGHSPAHRVPRTCPTCARRDWSLPGRKGCGCTIAYHRHVASRMRCCWNALPSVFVKSAFSPRTTNGSAPVSAPAAAKFFYTIYPLRRIYQRSTPLRKKETMPDTVLEVVQSKYASVAKSGLSTKHSGVQAVAEAFRLHTGTTGVYSRGSQYGPLLRQPDRVRQPETGRNRHRPRLRWRIRCVPGSETSWAQRKGHRHRYDARDAANLPAAMLPRRMAANRWPTSNFTCPPSTTFPCRMRPWIA